jgi:hypothetical protein
LPLKQQRAAEDFDLSLLASIEVDLLPRLASKSVPDFIATDLAQILQQGSRLYNLDIPAVKKGWFKKADASALGADDRRFTHSFDIMASTPLNGTTANITETHTERFAYWCFDLLFLVCHAPGPLLLYRSANLTRASSPESGQKTRNSVLAVPTQPMPIRHRDVRGRLQDSGQVAVPKVGMRVGCAGRLKYWRAGYDRKSSLT